MSTGTLSVAGLFLLTLFSLLLSGAFPQKAEAWSGSYSLANTGGTSPRGTLCDTFNASGIANGATVTINLTRGTMGDAYLYLFRSDGTVVAQNDDGLGNLNSTITTQWYTGYYIGASTYSGEPTGRTYTLYVSAGSWVRGNTSCGVPPKSNQSITFGALAGRTYSPGGQFNVSASASSGLPVSFSSSTTTICTVGTTTNTATVTMQNAGTCSITASQGGNTSYNAAPSVTQSFSIAKANQTITFGALDARTYSSTTFSVSATASSGLAPTFSSLTTGVCGVSGSTVSMLASGTCTIRASQAGNTNYNAATNVDQSFTISKANQTITFSALSDRAYGSSFAVSASTSSGLSVVFSSQTTGICTTTGSTVNLIEVGTCIIRASQDGNTQFNVATPIDQPFSVTKASQTLTFAALTDKVYGDAAFSVSGQATSTSGLAPVYTSATPAVCSTSGTNGVTVSIVAVGTCTINADQPGSSRFLSAITKAQSFSVSKKILTAASSSVAPKLYNGLPAAGPATVGPITGYVGNETLNISATASDYSSANVSRSNLVRFFAVNRNSSTFTTGKGTVVTSSTPGLCNSAWLTEINLDWGTGAPSGCNSDYFSTYFEATLVAPTSGAFTFYNSSDDGFYLTIDGTAVIDDWVNQAATSYNDQGTVNLVQGRSYVLRAWHFENSSGAVARLYWSYPGQSTTLVPASAFVGSYPTTISYSLADGTNGGLASNYQLASTSSLGVVTPRPLTFKMNDVVTDADSNSASRTFTATTTGLASTDSVDTWTTSFVSGGTSSTTAPSATTVGSFTLSPSALTVKNASASVPLANYIVTYQTGSYTIATGAPSKVSVPSFSGTAVSGRAFGTQPVVRILDALNNVITTGPAATAEVKATVTSGTNRALVGTSTISAFEGTARFSDLGISGDATQTYTVRYEASFRNASNDLVTLTVATQSVTPTFGTAAALRVSSNASGARSGVALATQPAIQVVDDRGNVVTTSTASISTSLQGTGAVLSGTMTRAASSGVASGFSLVLTGTARDAGTNSPLNLVFSSPGLTSVTQEDVPLGAGNAAKLSLTQRSEGTASGAVFTQFPRVMLFDSSNNVVDNVPALVTATLSQVNGTGTFVGGATSTTATASVPNSGDSKGIAEFSGLGITGLNNTTYTVTYSATVGGVVLTPARQDITVSVGAPTTLILATTASGAASGAQVVTQPRVILRDSGGNNVTSATHNGTVEVTAVRSTGSAVSPTVTNGSISLSSGVAQWSQLTFFGEATTYSLTYTYTGTSNTITLTRSSSILVTPGVATKLKVTQASSLTTASGAVISTQPIVEVVDAFGNTVTSSSAAITATMSGGSAVLAGTVVRSAIAGVGTYSGLSIRGTASTANDDSKYSFTFSSPGLESVTQSQKVSLTHGAANKTVITNTNAVQAGVAQAGKAFAVSPIVQIQDAWGNKVTTGSWATASIRPTALSGSLIDSSPIAAVSGEATMSTVGVNGTAGSRYVVQYQAYISTTVLSADSHEVTLTAGDASRLRLSTSPVGTASGSVFTTQPVVTVVDSNGNTAASSQTVTASITSGSGGSLVGTVTASAINGVATFSNLGISGTAGVTYRIEYAITSSSITATSSSVTVTPGAPDRVIVKTESSSSLVSGSNLTVSPVAKIVDATGNTVTTSTANVTVALKTGSPTGTLLGTTTRQAVNGEVSFTSLGIRGLIGRYSLEFSSDGLTSSTQTQKINVTPGPAAKIVAANASDIAAVNAPAGGSLAVQPVLRVTDVSGNAVGIDDGARTTITSSVSTGATVVNSSAVKTCAQGGACAVGDIGPAGGIIFYVAPSTQSWGRYLEAARNGWNGTVNDPSVNYGCLSMITGAQGTAIGTGAANTAAILAECPTAGIAARVADSYSVTVGGVTYDDWFVGSKDENYQIHVNREFFGSGNLPEAIWSSTNYAVDIAGATNLLTDGSEGGAHKTAQSVPVRPIRAVAAPAASFGVSGTAPTVYSMTYSGVFNTRTLTSATHTVTAVAGAATKVALTTPAVGTASGAVFATQPKVTLRDVANNTVSTDGVTVTMTITQVSSKGTLVGGATSTTATADTVNGVATFSGVGISGTAGQAYTVTYSASGLSTTTQSITVTPGAPAALTLTDSSTTVNSGAAFSTPPVIRIVDATGNVVNTSSAEVVATVSRVGSTGLGGELIGPTTIRAASGVATFTNLGVIGTAAVQYEMSYTATGFAAMTQTVTVQPGSPVALGFGNSPSTSVEATAFSVALATQPEVVLKDSAGNVTVQSGVSVTAAISAGGTLSGTKTVTTNASGVAAFTNLSVGAKINTYTITYSATGMTPVAHTVTPTVGPAASIVVDDSIKKIKAASGAPFNIDGQVRIVDAAGNNVNTNATITATSSATGSNGTLGNGSAGSSNSVSVTAVNGVAPLSSLRLTGDVNTYTITYSATVDGVEVTTDSNAVELSAGAASNVVLTTAAVGAKSDAQFVTQPKVAIMDAATGGNLVASRNSGPGLTMTAVSGTLDYVRSVKGTPLTPTSAGYCHQDSSKTQINELFGTGSPGGSCTADNFAVYWSGQITVPTTKTVIFKTRTDDGFYMTLNGNVIIDDWADQGPNFPNAVSASIQLQAGVTYELRAWMYENASGAVAELYWDYSGSDAIIPSSYFAVPKVSASITAAPAGAAGYSLIGTTEVNVESGIASFTNLGIKGPVGTYTIQYSSGGLTVSTQTIAVVAGAPSALGVASTSTVQAGAELADQVVTIVDTAGNPIITSASSITASITSANSANITFRGTKARGAVNGAATFDDLVVFGVADTYTLSFSTTVGATTLTASQTLTMTAGPAVRLEVQEFETAQIMKSGELFTPQPKVRVLDAYGNPVATQPSVTFTLEQVARAGQSSGVLVGADASSSTVKTVTAGVDGVAQFAGLGISGVDQQTYRVVIASGSLTPYAQTFALTTGDPIRVVLTNNAGEAQSDKVMGTQPVVEIHDSGGNVVNVDDATVTLTSSSGATFSSATAMTTDGIARFSGAKLSGTAVTTGSVYTATYSSTISSVVLTPATQSVVLMPGDIDRLLLTRTVRNESAGENFANQPVISLVDKSNNPVALNGAIASASIDCVASPSTDCAAARLIGSTQIEMNDGVATFTDLGINGKLATYAVKYSLTLGATTYTATQNVVLLGGNPSRMELTASPSSGGVGDAFTTPPVITLRDSSGNVANSSAKVTASVTPIDVYNDATAQTESTGQLVGTVEKNALSGVADFDGTGLGLTGRVGQRYVITYTATGLTPVTHTVSLSAGSPATMTVKQGIGDASSGAAFGQQPIVELFDVGGNLASGSPNVVATVTSRPAVGETLNGTATIATSAGRAAFTDLGISGKVGSYTVTFASTGLTSRTSTFTLNPGAPNSLVLATSATSPTESGTAFATQPVVELRDAQSNVITNAEGIIVATISDGVGGSLRGVARAALSSGIAEFETLGLTGLTANNPYTVRFALQGSNVTAATQVIEVAAGPAAALSLTESLGAKVGVAFANQTSGRAPVARIVDSGGNTITSNDPMKNAVITATVSSGGTLIGDVDIAATNGVVSFDDLGLIGTKDTSYTITYSTSGLASVSQTVTATTGPASQIGISTAADGARSGAVMSTQPVLQLRDAGNNPVSQADVQVSVDVVGTDAVLTGTKSVTTNNLGVASFANAGLELNGPLGVDYTLTYTAVLVSGTPSSAVTTSQSVRVQLGDPYKLYLVQSPVGTAVGQPFTTQPIVEIQDFGGNTVGAATNEVTVAIQRRTSAGDSSKSAGTVSNGVRTSRGGIAEFTNLSFIGTTGETYRLTFGSGSLQTVTHDVVATTGVPSQITVETAASAVTAAAGVKFSTPVVVKIRDVGGNVVDTSSVISARVSCTGNNCIPPALTGDTTETSVNGVATFDDLTLIGTAGDTPTITFEMSGVDTDTLVPTISVGPAVKLGARPLANNATRTAQSGMELSPPPLVELQDAGGNLVPSSALNNTAITATVTQVTVGGVATGEFVNSSAATALTTSGVAQFSGLSLTGVRGVAYTISYSTDLGTAQNPNVINGSEVVTVMAGISTNITLSTSAVGTRSGVVFSTSPSVTIRDTGGNTVENSTYRVRATLTQVEVDGVATGKFEGTLADGDTNVRRTVAAVDGVATFTGLGITGKAGRVYTITYEALNSSGVVVASHASVSQNIEVSVGPAVSLGLIQRIEASQSATVVRPVSGQVFAAQPVLEVRDSGGNRVTSSDATVTARIASASDSSTVRTTHRTLFTQPTADVVDVATVSVDAVDGVATFDSLGIKGKDSVEYTIEFSTNELAGGASDTKTQIVKPIGGTASTIAITRSGASSGSVASGAAFTVQPQITIRDAQGNTSVSSTSRILATLQTVDVNGVATGEFIGTAYADAISGVADFGDIGITGTKDKIYTVTYSLEGVSSITEQYTVGVGAPTKLRFVTEANGAVAGQLLTTQPRIEILDSGDNRTSSTTTVYATITKVDVGGVLTGELVGTAVNQVTGIASTTAVGGVATFSNVGLGGIAGTAYTITYSATDGRSLSTVSQAVTPAEGAAVQVGVLRQAADAVVGVPFAVQPRLAVQDSYGNVVRNSSDPVVATVSAGGTLIGATTRQAVSGIVEFNNLGLRGKSGESYTISYSLVGFAPRSQTIDLYAGAANRLTISQIASGAASGTEFTTEPRITINDADGNIVTTSNAVVEVSVRQVSGTGVLLGSSVDGGTGIAHATAVNGVASFGDLGLTGLNNTAYELTFRSTGLVSATQTVLVTTGPVVSLTWDREPSGTVVGAPFAVQSRIVLRDSGRNIVTQSAQPVVATIAGSGGSLTGQTSVTPVNGIVEFTDLGFSGTSGTSYTITYAVQGVTPLTQTFTATVGAPRELVLTGAVDEFVNGAIFTAQPVLTVRDAGGNVVSSPRVTVTSSVEGVDGSLIGTVSRVSNNGEVRFSGLGIMGRVGTSYTLRFSATDLTAATQTGVLSAALDGTVPEFGIVTSTADGFRVAIVNYDSRYTYTGTATSGGLVTVNATGVVTVSGLLPARQSTATVTSSRNGYTSVSRTVTGTAMPSPALTPAFDTPVATADGFTAQVTNYSTAFIWSVESSPGTTATLTTAGALRVVGAQPGQSVSVTVRTTRFGYLSGAGTTTSTALQVALTPSFGDVTRTEGGFTVPITNFSSDYQWNVSASSGAQASINGSTGTLEVTSLGAGQESTVTVKTIRSGFARGSNVVTARAKSEALVPLTSRPEATATGWELLVDNYDAAFTWNYALTTGSVTATSVSSTQVRLTVSGVTGLTQSQLTISTQRSGYLPGSSVVTLQRERGLIPQFGGGSATQTSFSVPVSNYDSDYTWSVTSTTGRATISPTGTVTVADLSPGTYATITVETRRLGYTTVSASLTYASLNANGQSILLAPLVADLSDAVSTSDGFTTRITNYDPLFTWSVVTTNGDVALSNDVITVTGLGIGQSATVTVVTNKSSEVGGVQQVHESGMSSRTGSAIQGAAHTFTLGTPQPTADGFTVQISGYDRTYSWDAAVTPGLALVSQTGLITVTGQTPGRENISVAVTAVRTGYATGTATATGSTTLGVAHVPAFGRFTPNVDGFTVALSNFNTFGGALGWAATTDRGSVSISAEGDVHVTDLDPGQTARVAVTTTHSNRRTGSSSFNGGALQNDGITSAVANALTPVFGAVNRTSDGFTTVISNYDSRYTYSTVITRASPAAVVISSTGVVRVTGVLAGNSETVTVLTNRTGYATGNASVTGLALATGTRGSNLLTGQPVTALCSTESAAREGISNVNDLSANTPFSCFNSATRAIAPYVSNSAGFFTGNIGNVILESVTFTSTELANDADRDPMTYSLWGCVAENRFCSAIVSNERIGFAADRSSRDVTLAIRNARPYNFYRLTFGSTRGSSNMVQIGEVSLDGRSAIAPALDPVLTTPVVSSSGFTTTIRNYSNLYVWSASVTSPGIVSIGTTPDANGAIPVTVTNLPPNTEANLEITTTRAGHLNGGAALDVTTSMGVGLTPLLSQSVLTADGMRVRIENFNSSGYQWSARLFAVPVQENDLGESVSISSNGLISINGKVANDQFRLVVRTSRIGYIDGTSSVDFRVLQSGLVATFGTPTPTPDGFSVQITNFDSDFNWRAVASNGGSAVVSDTGLLTVTNLGAGVDVEFAVTSTRSGYSPATTTDSASSLKVGLVPSFGVVTPTEDGFTVAISNYSALFTWSFSATNGATATFNVDTKIVTVSGVNGSSYLTASTSRTGYSEARASTGLSFSPALIPEFSENTLTTSQSGMAITLSNFNANYDWAVSVTPSGRAILTTTGAEAGHITVSGAPAGVELTLHVSTSRLGYNDGSAIYRATTSLKEGLVPSFAEPIRLVAGYSIEIANFDPSYTWQVTSTSGTASLTEGTVLVTGLGPVETATVTVTATKQGHTVRSASSTGSALPLPALTPRFATPTSMTNGFTTVISNYDSAFTWTASVNQGGTAAISADGTVRVTGIGGLTTATLTVTTTRVGYVSGGSSTTGTSLPFEPLVSQFGITQSTQVGFNVSITNFDPSFTYTATSSDTAIHTEVTQDGLLVVTGADLYEFVTVDVVTSRRGYTDGQSSVSAFALQEPQTSLANVVITEIQENAAGDAATVTTNLPHRVAVSDEVVISGIDDRFDGRHIVQAIVTDRKFTIPLTPLQSSAMRALALHAANVTMSENVTPASMTPPPITVSGLLRNGDERTITLNLTNPNEPSPLRTIIYIPYSAANPNASFTATALMSEAVPAGYRLVRLTAENADGSRVTELNVPVRIKLARPSGDAVPVYSGDNGATWRSLTRLEGATLPDGAQDGYYIDADGDLWVLTRHLSMFGALAPQAIPIVMTPGMPALTVGQTTTLAVSGGEGDGALTRISTTPTICTLSEDNTITALAAGDCVIEATKAASGRFVAATTRLSLVISPVPLTPVVPGTPDESVTPDVPETPKKSDAPTTEISPVIDTPTFVTTPGVAPKKKTTSQTPAATKVVAPNSGSTNDKTSGNAPGVDGDGSSTSPVDGQQKDDQSNNTVMIPGLGGVALLLMLILLLGAGGATTIARRRRSKSASENQTSSQSNS